MMRRRGTLFVECLIAILIFLIGVIALASSLAYSLRAIVQSREAIASDLVVSNQTETDSMRLALSPDQALSAAKVGNSMTVTLNGVNSDSGNNVSFTCNLYGYKSDNKYKTAFYLLGRK